MILLYTTSIPYVFYMHKQMSNVRDGGSITQQAQFVQESLMITSHLHVGIVKLEDYIETHPPLYKRRFVPSPKHTR